MDGHVIGAAVIVGILLVLMFAQHRVIYNQKDPSSTDQLPASGYVCLLLFFGIAHIFCGSALAGVTEAVGMDPVFESAAVMLAAISYSCPRVGYALHRRKVEAAQEQLVTRQSADFD